MFKKPKEKLTGKKKYDMITETAYGILEIVALPVIYFLVRDVIALRKNLMELNPTYEFPQISDLKVVPFFLVAVLVFRFITIAIFTKLGSIIMADKYKHPKTPGDTELAKVLPKKIGYRFYKLIMYIGMCTYSYLVLKDKDYFPRTLGGKGNLYNMYKAGYPNSYYFKRDNAFDTFYLFALATSISDFIGLLMEYGNQSDFMNMVLHHTCEMSLIVFSYLTNYSPVGSIVLYLHNISDIPNHFTKLFLRIEIPEIFTNIAGITFMISFLYFRNFVFIQILSAIYYGIYWKWSWVTTSLVLFLVFLFIMNFNWTMILLYKFVGLIFHQSITDNVSYTCEDAKKTDIKKPTEKKSQ